MTITTNDARNEYTATAGQTIFNYTFKIYADTDLNVYQTLAGNDPNDTTDLITTYSVAGAGSPSGGSITLNTGAALGDLITIVSNIPSSRTTNYQNNGDFLPDTVNEDNDRVVSLVKQIEDKSNRSLLLPESLQGTKPFDLPIPSSGSHVRWKATEDGFENVTIGTADIVLPVYQLSDYASLSAAVTAIGSEEATLIIDQGSNVTANLTIPETMETSWLKGYTLSVATGVALTYESSNSITAGRYTIFELTGTGVVVFSNVSETKAEWWGLSTEETAANNATYLTAAMTATFPAGVAGHLTIGGGTFPLDPVTFLDSAVRGMKITGVYQQRADSTTTGGTILDMSGLTSGQVGITIGATGDIYGFNVEISNLYFAGNENGNQAYASLTKPATALHLIRCPAAKLEKLGFRLFYIGLHTQQMFTYSLKNIQARQCYIGWNASDVQNNVYCELLDTTYCYAGFHFNGSGGAINLMSPRLDQNYNGIVVDPTAANIDTIAIHQPWFEAIGNDAIRLDLGLEDQAGSGGGSIRSFQIFGGHWDSITGMKIQGSGTADIKNVQIFGQLQSWDVNTQVDGLNNSLDIYSDGNVSLGFDGGQKDAASFTTTIGTADESTPAEDLGPTYRMHVATDTDATEVGTLEFWNENNSNNDRASSNNRSVAMIQGTLETTDSNADDDSGAHLNFWTKAEASVLRKIMTIDSSGFLQLFQGSDNHFKIYTQTETLADDAQFDLPAGDWIGLVGEATGGEGMLFTVTTAGAVTKISGTTNTAGTDSDTNLCVFDNGTIGAVKNRLGASRTVFSIVLGVTGIS